MIKKEKFQPVIKWTGSKRKISYEIVKRFPKDFEKYYEPFLGGGSILYQANPKKAICGDICEPLIGIWLIIRDNPKNLLEYYRKKWKKLQKEGCEVYYDIREKFNQTKKPEHLFFLSRTCVNGLIRFNQKGEFNNSFHHTRPGIHPDNLKDILLDFSKRIKNYKFKIGDYEKTINDINKDDFVYFDPPYFNTKSRYYGGIDEERFLNLLKKLNEKGIKYALSLDGYSGKKDYTVELPSWAYKEKFLLTSGKSTFKKVIDKEETDVKESLYLNYESPLTQRGQPKLDSF